MLQADYKTEKRKTEPLAKDTVFSQLSNEDIEEELIEIDKILKETILGKNNTAPELLHIQESKI